MAMEYFCCYHSYARKLAKLSDQEVGRLLRALLKYSETGEAQELTGRESVAFDFIADDIDRAKENYEAKCKQNRENRLSTTVNGRKRTSTSDYKNKDKSENKDKDEEKGGGTRAREGAPAAPAGFTLPPMSRAVEAFCNKINPTPSERSLAELESFEAQMGTDCCLRAIDEALDARATNWNYIRQILRSKLDQGVRCIADWDKLEEKRNARKPDKQDATGSSGADERWHIKSHTL